MKTFLRFFKESHPDRTSNVRTPRTVNVQLPHHDPSPKEIVDVKFRILAVAMKKIDPFIEDRQSTVFAGTADFTSPEAAGGGDSIDDDSITFLYLSLTKTNPYLASLLQPMARSFRRFNKEYVEVFRLVDMARFHRENVEFAYRMDVKKFHHIASSVEHVNAAIDSLQDEGQQVLRSSGFGPELRRLFVTWDRFYDDFHEAAPKVINYLEKTHKLNEPKRWDKTPESDQGPPEPSDPQHDLMPFNAELQ